MTHAQKKHLKDILLMLTETQKLILLIQFGLHWSKREVCKILKIDEEKYEKDLIEVEKAMAHDDKVTALQILFEENFADH